MWFIFIQVNNYLKFINAETWFCLFCLFFTVGHLILFEVSPFFHLHFFGEFFFITVCNKMQKSKCVLIDFSYLLYLLRSKKYSSLFSLIFLFQNLSHLYSQHIELIKLTSFLPTFYCYWKLFFYLFLSRLLVSFMFAVRCKSKIGEAQVYSFLKYKIQSITWISN